MKTAVFQISESDGSARLVCVPMPTLQAACSLEAWLRMQAGPERHIKLLGRFGTVHTAASQAEAESLALGREKHASQEADLLTVNEIVERILLRAGRP